VTRAASHPVAAHAAVTSQSGTAGKSETSASGTSAVVAARYRGALSAVVADAGLAPCYGPAEWRISPTNHAPSGVNEPEVARISIASRV
jgi:hypothetical protein